MSSADDANFNVSFLDATNVEMRETCCSDFPMMIGKRIERVSFHSTSHGLNGVIVFATESIISWRPGGSTRKIASNHRGADRTATMLEPIAKRTAIATFPPASDVINTHELTVVGLEMRWERRDFLAC